MRRFRYVMKSRVREHEVLRGGGDGPGRTGSVSIIEGDGSDVKMKGSRHILSENDTNGAGSDGDGIGNGDGDSWLRWT